MTSLKHNPKNVIRIQKDFNVYLRFYFLVIIRKTNDTCAISIN